MPAVLAGGRLRDRRPGGHAARRALADGRGGHGRGRHGRDHGAAAVRAVRRGRAGAGAAAVPALVGAAGGRRRPSRWSLLAAGLWQRRRIGRGAARAGRRLLGEWFASAGGSSGCGRDGPAVRQPGAGCCSATSLHLAGWFATGVGTWISLRLLGASTVELLPMLALEALLDARDRRGVRGAGRGRGAGGRAMSGWARVFGVPPELALSVSLLRRGKDIGWGVPILGALAMAGGAAAGGLTHCETARQSHHRGRMLSRFPLLPRPLMAYPRTAAPSVPVAAQRRHTAAEAGHRRRGGRAVQRPHPGREPGQAPNRRAVRPALGRLAGAWRRDLDDGRRRRRAAAADAAPGGAGRRVGPFQLPRRHAWPAAAHRALHRAHHLWRPRRGGGRDRPRAQHPRPGPRHPAGRHARTRPTTRRCWPGCTSRRRRASSTPGSATPSRA